MRNYKTWYWVAAVFQFLTAGIHSLSFLNRAQPGNETEKTLLDLMHNYRQQAGSMSFSMEEIMIALSACLTFVYLFGGLTNAWLLRRTQDETVLGGILAINLVVFGALFVIMVVYTFLPPIIMTGCVFLFLLVAAVMRKLVSR